MTTSSAAAVSQLPLFHERSSLDARTWPSALGIKSSFDILFLAQLALKEKQIQQNYRPVIAVHKWFGRLPGTLFLALLLSELGAPPLSASYSRPHDLAGLHLADPFMGGGTPLLETNRLGCDVTGWDINPDPQSCGPTGRATQQSARPPVPTPSRSTATCPQPLRMAAVDDEFALLMLAEKDTPLLPIGWPRSSWLCGTRAAARSRRPTPGR